MPHVSPNSLLPPYVFCVSPLALCLVVTFACYSAPLSYFGWPRVISFLDKHHHLGRDARIVDRTHTVWPTHTSPSRPLFTIVRLFCVLMLCMLENYNVSPKDTVSCRATATDSTCMTDTPALALAQGPVPSACGRDARTPSPSCAFCQCSIFNRVG